MKLTKPNDFSWMGDCANDDRARPYDALSPAESATASLETESLAVPEGMPLRPVMASEHRCSLCDKLLRGDKQIRVGLCAGHLSEMYDYL